MNLSRREFLRLAQLGVASFGLAGCAPRLLDPIYANLSAPVNSLSGWQDAGTLAKSPALFQILNRLTFGATASERLIVAQIGMPAWIEEQIAPQHIDDWRCDTLIRRMDTLHVPAHDLADLADQLFDNVDLLKIPSELRQATLLRQVFSRRQLFELMVDFWSNHFNISVDKGDCHFLKTIDDREVIRKHALGNFGDLLMASAHSPAMLVYLDNQSNHKDAPNENYARELLELHSLGVDGGYTQQDVMELARCLTGWTVKERFWRGQFTFKPEWHDDQSKQVLGRRIEPAGQAEVEQILGVLALHPKTASYLAGKLARFFIAEEPPAALVDSAANAFLRSGGEIKAVLQALFEGGLGVLQPKYRRPAIFVVAALRMLGARTNASPALLDYLNRMGQPYFGWPTPDGYPDRTEAWLGNFLPRWQFALDLSQNRIAGTNIDLAALYPVAGHGGLPDWLDGLAELLFGAQLTPTVRRDLSVILNQVDMQHSEQVAISMAALLASPAFQWR